MGSRPKTLAEIKFQEQLTEYISIIKEQAKADQLLGSREAFLENSIDYSKNFLERIERYGVTELGEKLTLLNWNKEHLLGVSDTRIYSVATTGNAQCGKTLQNTLFLIDFTLFSNLDTIWFYPTKTIMDSLVPNMFGRLSTEYLANLNKHLGLDIKTDRKSNTNCSFRQANIYFRYASTSAQEHTDKRRGLATVGGSAASISGNVLFIEERSQISPDAVSTLYRRLDAARLPGGLVREIGTPGNGLGIEIQEKDADHHFYPHVTCPNCQADIKLSPKGCLLKVQPNGKYLSASGRPVSWYHSDPENPIESAYFACTNCGICLGGEARKLAFFKCTKKGVDFRDFYDQLPTQENEIYSKRLAIIFHLSPLLRQTKFNLAATLIKVGLLSESTRDYQQQFLGFASESDDVRLTQELLAIAIDRFPPLEQHTVTIAGVDQGRHQDWITITRYWLKGFKVLQEGRHKVWVYQAESSTDNPLLSLEQAEREIVYIGAVNRKDILKMLSKYDVDYGFIDNEPDIPDAYQLSTVTPLKLADQKQNLFKVVNPIQIMGGSMAIEGYGIDAEYFKDRVLHSFIDQKVSMVASDLNDRSPNSVVRHMTSPEKDLENNVWVRPKDKNDDCFFATMFCEAATHQWVIDKIANYQTSVLWYTKVF